MPVISKQLFCDCQSAATAGVSH